MTGRFRGDINVNSTTDSTSSDRNSRGSIQLDSSFVLFHGCIIGRTGESTVPCVYVVVMDPFSCTG